MFTLEVCQGFQIDEAEEHLDLFFLGKKLALSVPCVCVSKQPSQHRGELYRLVWLFPSIPGSTCGTEMCSVTPTDQ
jgi:hypothetical protein